jgi:predicted RNA-binding Zn-ribbon protein involved in translation (DUF1610 family)
VKCLGFPGLRVGSFGAVGFLLLQIIVASMNMVAGILAVTYYALYAGPTGVASSPGAFLLIALFALIFGVLSFTLACLSAIPFSLRTPEPENIGYEAYPPLIITREYVTQRRQTIAEQAWAGFPCPNCGRIVSLEDNFCDLCGARSRGMVQQGEGIAVESTEKTL